MPTMTYTPQFYSEPSVLTPGVHPAFLMAILDEVTPPTWEMAKKSPRMWRWHWAVAHTAQTFDAYVPELVTAVCSKIFSGGKQASKNYTWHCTLLGRVIAPDESVDLDPMMPLPCQLAISRTKGGVSVEWAIVDNVYAWPDGAALLTEPFRQKLALWWSMKQAGGEQPTEAPPAPAPAVPQMYQPTAAAPLPPSAPTTAGAPVIAPATRHAW
jgi:hypothetical protein